MSYDEFLIEIDAPNNGVYPFRVEAAGGERAKAELTLPLDNQTYLTFTDTIAHRDILPTSDEMIEFGTLVHQTLFGNQAIWGVFSRAAANKRLQITFVIDAAATQAMAFPWEFVCDQAGNPLAQRHTLRRFLPLAETIPSVKISGKLTILLAAASPAEFAQHNAIDIPAMLDSIRTQLKPFEDRGEIQVIEDRQLTSEALRTIIAEQQPQVVHILCHGVSDANGRGALVLVDEEGKRKDCSSRQLNAALADSSVRLVMLNACNSSLVGTNAFHSIAPNLLSINIPAVVAAQAALRQDMAQVFSKAFYRSLVQRQAIDTCVADGRKAVIVNDENAIDWALMTLYTRAKDGQLFDSPQAPQSTATPTQTHAQPTQGGTNATINFGDGASLSGTNISIGNVGTTIQNSGERATSTAAGGPAGFNERDNLLKLRDTLRGKAAYLTNQQAGLNNEDIPYSMVQELERTKRELQQVEEQIRQRGWA